MATLHVNALALSVELRECGHDILPADLLDALATTGLTLRISDQEAAQAYYETLRDTDEEAA